jgi:hypothetical protein
VLFEMLEGALAVVGVAMVIAIDEMCADLSQVACFDRLATSRATGLPAGCPAIHQCESHVASPWIGTANGIAAPVSPQALSGRVKPM